MSYPAIHPTSTRTLSTCRYRAHLADRHLHRRTGRYRSRAYWCSHVLRPWFDKFYSTRGGMAGHHHMRLRRSRGKR